MLVEVAANVAGVGGPGPASPGPATTNPDLQQHVAIAALAVLVLANLIGLWLAALLLWPELGRLTGPLTYGRWMPLHLDVQLFGWCSLPVIGSLLARFLPVSPRALNAAAIALAAWCGALAAGALAWLGGHTSGKVFLDWSGPAGLAFTGAQCFLWCVLAAGWWTRLHHRPARPRPDPDSKLGNPPGDAPRSQPGSTPCNLLGYTTVWQRAAGDALLLAFLLAVPVALHFAARPGVSPPVNPHSGGATGHSLLASSLGIVGIALALPALLGRPAVQPGRMRRATAGILIGFAANWGCYMLIRHGNASNHEPAQIAGLGTLLAWPVWLVWWFRKFSWAPTHRRWLLTAAVWATLLVLDGFLVFLPGVLERAKFTNALVAHSHLAMAGLLTSLNLLMLISLAPHSQLAAAFAKRRAWLAWNVACLAMVVVLTALGWSEGAAPRLIADGSTLVTAGYVARLVAGAVMLLASVQWLRAALLPDVGPDLVSGPPARESTARTQGPALQMSKP